MPRPQRKFIDILEKSMVVADTMDREDLMFTYKGIPYPTTLCSYEVFKAMESFEARSDDMILAGFPKSGTNWFGHILLELITTFEKKTEVEPTIYGEEFDEFPYLEIGDTEKYQRMKKIPFRRVIRTHLMSQNLPKSVFTNKAKILLLLRNPKDLATSFFKFSKVMAPFPTYDSWDEFFKDFMTGNIPWGSYFTYLSEWNKHADDEHVMPITFEEVKENPLLGVKKIAKFFELPLTEEELKGVAERSSFQAMKNNSKETHGVFGNVLFRKGTNWVGQIITDLVTTCAKNNGDETNNLNDELDEFPYLEVGDAEKYQRMKKLPSRRIIFTHLMPHNIPESIFKNKTKILLLLRNPKDVATSYYHFSNGLSPLPSYETWDEFFTAFMTGKMPWGFYFDYIFEWNKHIDDENIMTITYEELKENRAMGVKKIAEFFELSLTEEELQGVVDRSSFQAMKENSEKTHGAFGNVLFRKGGVSDWKNLFNEDQNQEMDKKFEEYLAGTKLGAKLNYGVHCKA